MTDTSVVVEGIDVPAVSAWFAGHVPGVSLPLAFDLIAGGHSNLTFRVTDAAGSAWVLRRPPLGHLLPTAHDMAREHRILSALQGTSVPVPALLGLCDDPAVNGAPFYVMQLVEGYVLRNDEAALELLDAPGRHHAGLALADTLAAIHQVDPAEVGLGDLGRPTGYVARQLKRWKAQLDNSKVRPLPDLDIVHDQLLAHLPEEGAPGIVHGDFRLDNCIIGPDAEVRAVLDWELCTLGDPLADVGLLMVYWSLPEDDVRPLADPPTLAPGFPTRAELIDRYAETRGIAVPDVSFYIAFGYWRLACITEGVYARYLSGGMGDRREQAAPFEHSVPELGRAARNITAAW